MFYVYVLKSLRDGKHYVGQTSDLKKRIRQHLAGMVKSTRGRRPFEVLGYEVYKTRSQARWVEYSIKQHSDKKRKFIDTIVRKGRRP